MSRYSYPVATTMLTEARMYAVESINYTMDYDGWDDGHKKMERITTGKFAQLWLCEFCRVNNILYQKDRSSPKMADSGDLVINGWNVDCKVSTIPLLAGQVSKHHDSPKNNINIYFFFLTDGQMSFIKPVGCIRKEHLIDVSKKVLEGEKIPDTNIVQRFGYSYFADTTKLPTFETTIKHISKVSFEEDQQQEQKGRTA